jgi:AcrR family transcriptional regulator
VAAHQLARIYNATIQLVAERGYKTLKVRDIVGLAEVSTRAFYEHFSSKEDCFLQTHDLISRRATRRIIGAQVGERDWRKRTRLVFEEFVRGLENDPSGARFVLVEAYAASGASLDKAWRAERILEGLLTECLARTPGGVVIPPMIIEGMVAGVASVFRGRLHAGRLADLQGESGDELLDWALCYSDEAATELVRLDGQSVWRDTTLEPLAVSSTAGDGAPWQAAGDRALIVDAVAKLAVKSGYAGLTASRICSAAGVSRRKFYAHFEDVEDCYLAALEQHAGEAVAQAGRAQVAANSWPGGIYRAITSLCHHVAGNPFLTRLCLTDDFPPGSQGRRSRKRLVDAIVELLSGDETGGPNLAFEASIGAIWSVFHHHIVRSPTLHRRISATLTYLALTPAIGASTTVVSIKAEQNP